MSHLLQISDANPARSPQTQYAEVKISAITSAIRVIIYHPEMKEDVDKFISVLARLHAEKFPKIILSLEGMNDVPRGSKLVKQLYLAEMRGRISSEEHAHRVAAAVHEFGWEQLKDSILKTFVSVGFCYKVLIAKTWRTALNN